VQSVSDDGADIESALQHDGHFIPRFVHFASVDPVDGQHIEHDLCPVDGDVSSGDTQHGNFTAVCHVGQHAAEGIGVTGHFEADIEAFGHTEFLLDVFEAFGADIDGASCAHFLCQLQSPGIDVGDNDKTCAGMTDYGGSHQADWSGAGDQNIFAEDGEGESGMYGIAEGVKDGGDIAINTVVMMPDIGHGQGDIFSKCAGAIDADALSFGAQVSPSGEAVAAATADHVPFTADDVTGMEVSDV